MRITAIFMMILSVMLTLSATDAIAKDEVYRWVDENGVVHYGDHPGGTTTVEEVGIKKGPSTSSQPYSAPATNNPGQQLEPSYAQQRRNERSKNREEAAQLQQTIDAGCAQRRQIIAQMEPSTRVMVTGKDGGTYRMDDDDRLDSLAEAKTYIAEKCNK